MNDKKLMKALIVAGTIAAGVAFNSTDVKAAELNEVEADIIVADTVEQEEDSETKAGELSDAAKELEAEIANAQRDVISAEAAYKAADEEFNVFAEESKAILGEYNYRMQMRTENPDYLSCCEHIAEYWDLKNEAWSYINRFDAIFLIENYEETDEYEQLMAEFYDRYGSPYPGYAFYVMEYCEKCISDLEYEKAYICDNAIEMCMPTVEHYNELKAKRDEAAQTLADAQKKLDDLNVKKAALENPVEETVLSEDVYKVFNTAKAVVMEHPEILQRVYEYYDIDELTEEDVFDYIVSKLDVETINYYAKELSSMEITPEVINTYMDMFFDWIAR